MASVRPLTHVLVQLLYPAAAWLCRLGIRCREHHDPCTSVVVPTSPPARCSLVIRQTHSRQSVVSVRACLHGLAATVRTARVRLQTRYVRSTLRRFALWRRSARVLARGSELFVPSKHGFCENCGALTISRCLSCSAPLSTSSPTPTPSTSTLFYLTPHMF